MARGRRTKSQPASDGTSAVTGLPRALVLLVLVAIAPGPAVAGQARDEATATSRIEGLLKTAATALASRRFVEAITPLEAAAAESRAAGLDTLRANSLTALGEVLYYARQYGPAGDRLREALAIWSARHDTDGVGRASLLLSMVEDIEGQRAEALDHARQAQAAYATLDNPQERARADLQFVAVSNSSADESRLLLERVIEDARRAGAREVEARALHALGDNLFNASQQERALEVLTRAAALFHELGTQPVAEGTVLNSIGRVYRAHGRLPEALKFQLSALAIHERSNDSYFLTQSLNAVASVYQRLGDLPTARRYYERALALAEQSASPRIQDFLRANVGGLLLSEGHYAQAARTFEQVIAHDLDAFPATRQAQLSMAYTGLHRHADALAAADRSVALCGSSRDACLTARAQRAAARQAAGQLAEAEDDVRVALDELERLREQLVPTDFFRQNFHLANEHIYSQAIALRANDDPARAVETAERARSRALLDLLASRALPASDRPLADATPATAADLERTATRLGSTIVSYWVTDTRLFIWVVRPGLGVEGRHVDVRRSHLAELVRATAPLAGEPRRPRVDAWQALYAVLIEPIRGLLPATKGSLLTIVPHGPLAGLSFAALRRTPSRYLIEDYTLHYAPAGALLQFTFAKRRTDARSGPLLLIADPELPRLSSLDRPLNRLPGARAEAAAVGRLMTGREISRLQGAAATETAVRAAAAGKAVLHLATHAVVQDDDPFGSFLALGPSGTGAAGDGVFTAQEVYGLTLDADLTVLSACRSAAGTVAGDGIATFARAFLYAGSASVVASTWDVPDDATGRLWPAFYRAWSAGASKAAALRSAQLQLLADLRAGRVRMDSAAGPVAVTEHPVFWAGFALFGEPD